jgi:hypothetical protein
VTPNSSVIIEGEKINHNALEEIFALQKIESNPNVVRVKFIAKEPGVYKILWSNNHSWFKAKTLVYRVIILKNAVENTNSKSGGDKGLSVDSRFESKTQDD